MNNRQHVAYLLLCLPIVLLLGIWTIRDMLLDPYIQVDDFRNLYGVHRIMNPALLSGMEAGDLENASRLYFELLALMSRVFTPLMGGKVLGLFLLVAGAYYAYQIGRLLASPSTGAITAIGYAVFNLAAESEITAVLGLQRSFITPLFLALLHYLFTRRYMIAAVVVILSGLIYPPAFPVSVLTYGLSAVVSRPDKGFVPTVQRTPAIFLMLAVAVVLLVQLPVAVDQVEKVQSGQAVPGTSPAHILENPLYQKGGRRALFLVFPFIGRGGLVTHVPAALQLALLGAAGAVTRLILGSRAVGLPPAARWMFWSSLIVFALSWLPILLLSSFLLYIPSRHTQSSFFVLLVLYVTVNARNTLAALSRRIGESRRILPWIAMPLLLLLGALVFFLPTLQATWYDHMPWLPIARWLLLGLTILLAVLVVLAAHSSTGRVSHPRRAISPRLTRAAGGLFALLLAAFYLEALGPIVYVPTEEQRALFSFVETLPTDALIAGNPCTLDDIPFYARRSVVFNCELFEGDQMILDSLRAYYATDAAAVWSFCRQYGINYFIVHRNTLTREAIAEQSYFFTPYTTELAPELNGRDRFYLATIPERERLFSAGPYFVVDCLVGGEGGEDLWQFR